MAICPKCGFDAPEDMPFCGRCGESLIRKACRRCGRENPLDFNFCGFCGAPLTSEPESPPDYTRRSPDDYTPAFLRDRILKNRSAVEGERKIVTVLFADVVGFTQMAEGLDPEDVHEIMDGCFDILGPEIHEAGGTVNQYTGDGVMALFGAPVALEDHIDRACLSALRIRDRLRAYDLQIQRLFGTAFRMRIGIHTGAVVVGSIGDNLRLDYTAVGDTTNLAARLQEAAPPGEILVSEQVRRSAGRHFVFEEKEALTVKGKRSLQTAFLLTGETSFDIVERFEQGKSPPFIDRLNEIDLLSRALEMARRQGVTLVGVTGEAGIGKSRLLTIFLSTQRQRGATVLEGRCRSQDRDVALHPFSFLFAPETEDPRAPQDIQGQVPPMALFEQIRRGQIGPDLIDDAHKRALFREMRRYMVSLAETGDVIVAVDNMHWADTHSRNFLAFLLRVPTRVRMLVICSGRPDAGQWMPAMPHTTIDLGPLSKGNAVELLSIALSAERLDDALSAAVLDKAGGNPLYLLETAEHLKNRNAVALDDDGTCRLTVPADPIIIPDSVRGLLAARLDSLPEDGKRIAQMASVIGDEFPVAAMEAMDDGDRMISDALSLLERKNIFKEAPDGDGSRYRFHHPMLREVAYRALLRPRKRAWHRRAGQALESVYWDRLFNHVGTLAHHFFEGRDWTKALAYSLEAGIQARRSYACREALNWFEKALTIIDRQPTHHAPVQKLQVQKWIGALHVCEGNFEKGQTAFETMAALARETDDVDAEADARFRIGWLHFLHHQPDRSIAALEGAIELSRQFGIDEVLLTAKSFLGSVYSVLGRLKDAKPLLIDALDLIHEVDTLEARAWCLSYLIQYYNWIGEFTEGLAVSEDLLKLNEELRSPYFSLLLHFQRGLIFGALGRLQEAEPTLLNGLRRLEGEDEGFWKPRLLNTLGWIYSENDDLIRALELNQRALEAAAPFGDTETRFNAEINIGENYLAVGDLNAAKDRLLATWQRVASTEHLYTAWRYTTRLQIAMADLYRRIQDTRAAETIESALAAAMETGSKRHIARALQVRARIRRHTDPERARQDLQQARKLSTEMGTRILTQRIEADLAALI